ncbi:hypothetical protein [Arthrobacter globiformis]|uniref:hypothetical protein n=1 Tax=Arthrobacter globiformis TaxID=1665 RepID=UPI002792ED6F|nr:hypothetical protein [Arthrobacter globiformis]MDQ0617315.1 ABC-type glycerol-3-phosphate transport system substrate-binding protein [Arthrobacter globiformis]
MPYRKSLAATALLLSAAVLTGCGAGPSSAPSETPTPTKTVPPNGEHYSSVEALKDAFLEVGGQCSTYNEGNAVTLAAESATCGEDAVLSIYSSSSDKDQVVANMKQFSDVIGMKILVGENWIVNNEDVATLQPKLGGTLVTREAKT